MIFFNPVVAAALKESSFIIFEMDIARVFFPFIDVFRAKNRIVLVFLCRWVGRFWVPAYSKQEFSVQRIFVVSMYTVQYR